MLKRILKYLTFTTIAVSRNTFVTIPPHRHFPSFNQEDGLFELNIYRILNRFGIYKEDTCYLSDGFTNCSSNSKFLSPQTIE